MAAEAFVRVVELGLALNIKPLPEHDGCWEHEIDERWWIAVNGHDKPQLMRKHPNLSPLAPYTIYVEFNGWPAGLLGIDGGCIAAGEAANERTFIEALLSAIRKAGGTPETF